MLSTLSPEESQEVYVRIYSFRNIQSLHFLPTKSRSSVSWIFEMRVRVSHPSALCGACVTVLCVYLQKYISTVKESKAQGNCDVTSQAQSNCIRNFQPSSRNMILDVDPIGKVWEQRWHVSCGLLAAVALALLFATYCRKIKMPQQCHLPPHRFYFRYTLLPCLSCTLFDKFHSSVSRYLADLVKRVCAGDHGGWFGSTTPFSGSPSSSPTLCWRPAWQLLLLWPLSSLHLFRVRGYSFLA